MSEWNKDYQDEFQRLEFFFSRLYPTWIEIDTNSVNEWPDTLDRLHEALFELVDALTDFADEVEIIKTDE